MDIIPFGKYKGQPVEVLASDRQYAEWMLQQGNFIDRFPNVKAFIINNLQEPADTPEHNKLQAMFLNSNFCDRFIGSVQNKWTEYSYDYTDVQPVFEENGFDVSFITDSSYYDIHIELKPSMGDDYPSVLRQVKSKTHKTAYYGGKPFKNEIGGRRVVLIESYTGTGATYRDVVRMFSSSYILLMSTSEF